MLHMGHWLCMYCTNTASTEHGAYCLAGSAGVKSTVCMYTAVTQQTLCLAGSAGMKSTDCTMSTAVMQQTLSTANTEHVALCLQRAPTVQCSKTANTEHVTMWHCSLSCHLWLQQQHGQICVKKVGTDWLLVFNSLPRILGRCDCGWKSIKVDISNTAWIHIITAFLRTSSNL